MTRAGKVVRAIFFAAVFVVVMAAVQVAAQSNSGQNVPKYNVAQEQTIQGVVQEVKDYQCPISGTIGTHIIMSTDKGNVEVHMAPAKFFKDYDLIMRKGADVTVTGNKVEFDGK